MRLGVLFLLVILLDRTTMGYYAVNMATIAGQPVTMSCGRPISSGACLIRWKYQPIGSLPTILLFNGYNITKDRPKFSLSVLQPKGLFLVNNDPDLEDAGFYHCLQPIEMQGSCREKVGIVGQQLTVFSTASTCGSNANNGTIVENDRLRMWCSVHYLGNLDPVMEWSRDDGTSIDSNASYNNTSHPFNLTTTASEMVISNKEAAKYICKTFFKTPAMAPEKNDTFTARNAPVFSDECKLTISVLYGPRNLSITPRRNTYARGDRLRCSASGNPPPKYSWKDVNNGHAVDGPYLTVDNTMEQRTTNNYSCTAENTIAGEKERTSKTITFNVAATVSDPSSGGSLTVIVGTGAAVGGIAATVAGVILWRLAKRKCQQNQPKVKECAEIRDSPHDYESVNSGDTCTDATQQTPDIEMNQSSIMANQTMDQFMTEAEDGVAVVATERHYDTLDGCRIIQETRPYGILEAANPEEHAIESRAKPHDYYNVDMNTIHL